jgi:hypothetical protein
MLNTSMINDSDDNQSELKPTTQSSYKQKKKKFSEESGIRSIKAIFAQL